LIFGVTKRDKWEWLIEKGVEMGVTSFIPLISERNREYAKGIEKKKERFEKIAIAAMKQSKRCLLPSIKDAIFIKDIGSYIMPQSTYLLSFSGTEFEKSDINSKDFFLIVGPEGGFSEKEEDFLTHLGVKKKSLGIYTLKTETAALKSLSLITHFAGNF
jgi:16S rRNA (uracil1498-N3)-methyltransferase